jgi:hypothetical protein
MRTCFWIISSLLLTQLGCPKCTNPCTDGQTQCHGTQVQTCVPNGSCLVWSAPAACAGNQFCDSGLNKCTECSSPCTIGSTQCAGSALQTCATDVRGCPAFGSSQNCPSGQTCVGGSCIQPCGPSNCTGCCDSGGHCSSGTAMASCGAGGAACTSCIAPSFCGGGQCRQAVCGNGVCEPGENQANCCADCGCPGILGCLGNVCRPICGNGVCEPGEPGNCCADCGCADGYACQGGTSCLFVGTSTLSWTFANQCFNGENIEFKIFDTADRLVWPAPPLVYVSSQGATNTDSFLCTTGSRLCFGGDQPVHHLSWGIGINGTGGCTNCCYICSNASASTTLTCP